MEGDFGLYGEFIPDSTECTPEQRAECQFGRCYKDVHHTYFFERLYQDKLEKKFRDLGENLIRLGRCVHIELHQEIEPPEKPPTEHMIWRIRESDEHISVRLRKFMEQYEEDYRE